LAPDGPRNNLPGLRRFHVGIWDSDNLKSISGTGELQGAYPLSLDHSPTSEMIALGCQQNQQGKAPLFLGEYTQGKLNFIPIGDHLAEVWAVAFSRDGKYLFSGSHCFAEGVSELRINSVPEGKVIYQRFHSSNVSALAVSPTGKQLAVGDSNGYVQIVSAEDLGSLEGSFELQLSGTITNLSFSNDGKFLACGATTGQVTVLRIEEKRLSLFRELIKTGECITGVRFDKTANTLVTSTVRPKGGIHCWDLNQGREIGPRVAVPGVVLHSLMNPTSSSVTVLTRDGFLSVVALPFLK
jgi:WD40 repeat protein